MGRIESVKFILVCADVLALPTLVSVTSTVTLPCANLRGANTNDPLTNTDGLRAKRSRPATMEVAKVGTASREPLLTPDKKPKYSVNPELSLAVTTRPTNSNDGAGCSGNTWIVYVCGADTLTPPKSVPPSSCTNTSRSAVNPVSFQRAALASSSANERFVP